MKKLISLVLVALLLLASAAFAYDFDVSVARGNGQYGSAEWTKTSSTGSPGSVTIAEISNNTASMYYQIRKMDNVGASEELITKGTGTHAMPYWLDGNGNSLGRYNYTYKIRIAHRSQSSYAGTVISRGYYTP